MTAIAVARQHDENRLARVRERAMERVERLGDVHDRGVAALADEAVLDQERRPPIVTCAEGGVARGAISFGFGGIV